MSTDRYPYTLAELRHRKRLLQHQIPGLSKIRVCELETGRGSPGPKAIAALSDAYGVPPVEILAAFEESKLRGHFTHKPKSLSLPEAP